MTGLSYPASLAHNADLRREAAAARLARDVARELAGRQSGTRRSTSRRASLWRVIPAQWPRSAADYTE
jgi:hypothetical protein